MIWSRDVGGGDELRYRKICVRKREAEKLAHEAARWRETVRGSWKARVNRRLPLMELRDQPNFVEVESVMPKDIKVTGLCGWVES